MELKPIDIAQPGACVDFDNSLRETGFALIDLKSKEFADLLDRVYAEWSAFFGDPIKHKYDFKLLGGQSGYFPFRSENSKDSQIKDLKEFYHLYKSTEVPHIPEQWARLGKLGFSSATWEMRDWLVALSETLLMWLDLCGDFHDKFTGSEKLMDMISGSEQTLLRVLHYPPLNGDEEPGAVRAAAHEDINLLTLLPAATTSGLQVLTKEGTWYDVPGEKGLIIVNAGDMLQEATSGYYKSTTHRVVNPAGEAAKLSRYSLPLFLHPRPDVRLSTRYTAGEYLDQRLKELGLK